MRSICTATPSWIPATALVAISPSPSPIPGARWSGWLPGDWLIATGLAEEQAGQLVPNGGRASTVALDAFADRLAVSRDGRSHVINVSFTSTDPAKAALIANEAAELYIEDQLAAKRSATTKASAWLWERIEALRDELEALGAGGRAVPRRARPGRGRSHQPQSSRSLPVCIAS